MLLELPYKEGDVVSLKLTSGEEVIARLDKEDATNIVVNKPLMVIANQQGLGLAPFMFTVKPEAKFKINTSNVLCTVKTDDDMAKQYISSTSGIAVV
jgi:hypothetical protein